MSTLGVSTMILAGAMSTGTLPLDLQSVAQARGAWLTAADVVRPDAGYSNELRDKLAHLRLLPVRSCAEITLSQRDVAHRIARQLPGVFAVGPALPAHATMRVQVSGQTLTSAQLAQGVERSEARSCPASMGRSCAVRLLQPAPDLCLPQGAVQLRTDVTQTTDDAAPLTVRTGVFVDGVHVTTLRLAATAAQGFPALQLKQAVAEGQALRAADVLPVRVAHPAAVRTTYYDARAGVARAAGDLVPGDIVSAPATPALAVARAHQPVQLVSRVGPVQVSRSAHLATDVRASNGTTWAYFDDGNLAVVRPAPQGTWELIR